MQLKKIIVTMGVGLVLGSAPLVATYAEQGPSMYGVAV